MPKNVTKMSTANAALQPRRRTKKELATAQVESGVAGQRDATVKMKKVFGGASVLRAMAGDASRVAEAAVRSGLESTDDTWGQGRGASAPSVPLELEKEAIVQVAAGASPRQVEVEYGLHQGFVAHALKRRFGSPEAAKQALRGFVLENALACQVVAAKEIPNMSGPQAVMSGAILIDKALALEKSIAEQPRTINFAALADIGKTLKVLKEITNGEVAS